MAITKSVKQHIYGWWPIKPAGGSVTGRLLKQIVTDLEEGGIDFDTEIRVERSSGGWLQGFRLQEENVIQVDLQS